MSNEAQSYFEQLLLRCAEAVYPTFRPVVLADGKFPERSRCHENAKSFACSNPDYSVVRGWLIETSVNSLTAHSLVRRNKETELIEITEPHSFRFIKHDGDLRTFEVMSKLHPRIGYGRKQEVATAQGDADKLLGLL